MTAADSTLPRRPELLALTPGEQHWVRVRAWAHGVRCPGCRRRTFDVGDALFLGFLFVTAGPSDYRVALTCRNRACPAPRTGVTLRAGEFLDRPT